MFIGLELRSEFQRPGELVPRTQNGLLSPDGMQGGSESWPFGSNKGCCLAGADIYEMDKARRN